MLKGDLDLQGLLGLDDIVPAGYEHINIQMQVKADRSGEELEDLTSLRVAALAGLQQVCRPVPVLIERVKA